MTSKTTQHPKKQHRSGVHPTDAKATDDASAPITSATAQKVLALIGFTEAEGQALIAAAASPATPDELAAASKTDVDALGHALDDATVHALVTDPVLELPSEAGDFEAVAARLRVAASGIEKLEHCIDELHGASRLDADLAQHVLGDAMPKIKARVRSNPKVRTTYSSLLAYQAHRFPGRHGRAGHAAAPTSPASPTPAPVATPSGTTPTP